MKDDAFDTEIETYKYVFIDIFIDFQKQGLFHEWI